MSGCDRCSGRAQERTYPEGLHGRLYLAPPLGHTTGTIKRLVRESRLSLSEAAEGTLCVEAGREEMTTLSGALRRELSAAEMKDTRAVILPAEAEFGISDLAGVRDLGTLTALVEAAWLREIAREDRFTVHFQPIVRAAEPEQVFAYECLLRGLDGEGALVSPGPMFDAAREAGLLFELDRRARIKAIEEASAHDIRQNVFINFNPTSIYDPVYCLRSTMEAIDRSGIPAENIVFEVTETDEVRDTEHLYRTLEFYRNAEFRIALDDLGAGYSSLNLLARLRPDFVKLDLFLTRDVDADPYKAMVAKKVMDLARELGATVVAEGVETEEEWRWFRENGADLVQGYFFARPASPPPSPASLYAAR